MKKELLSLLDNYCLICAALGWSIAQIIKFIIGFIKEHRFSFTLLMSSGGMPSSHAATVCALTTACARLCGLNSPEFAITFALSFIVMYDAAGVRRAAGEQAKLLNRIMEDLAEGRPEDMPKRLKELIGHTPLQVVAGAILGVVIGLLFCTKQ